MTIKFANEKATIKAELERAEKKYPANINGLTDDFICNVFAPKLPLEEMVKIDAKRDEYRAKTKPADDGTPAKVGNWFPAFRSWVGKTYFAEFGSKKKPKKSEDKNGESLKELIAKLKTEAIQS